MSATWLFGVFKIGGEGGTFALAYVCVPRHTQGYKVLGPKCLAVDASVWKTYLGASSAVVFSLLLGFLGTQDDIHSGRGS